MKKIRYLAGLAGIVPAAAGFMVPAAAHATATPGEAAAHVAAMPAGTAARHSSRTAKAVNLTHIARRDTTTDSIYYAFIDANSVYLNKRSGGKALMYNGDVVGISCYYSGTGLPDPYWDHVVYESSLNKKHGPYFDVGHVADSYVNLGGLYPASVGIPHCG